MRGPPHQRSVIESEVGLERAFLQALLRIHEEARCISTVNQTVVVEGQRQVNHQANRGDIGAVGALHYDRTLHDRAGTMIAVSGMLRTGVSKSAANQCC